MGVGVTTGVTDARDGEAGVDWLDAGAPPPVKAPPVMARHGENGESGGRAVAGLPVRWELRTSEGERVRRAIIARRHPSLMSAM